MNQCSISVGLVAFGWRFFATNPNSVVLSVWIGVGGCLWPIYSTVVCAGIACHEWIYSAPIFASSAEIIMFFLWFVQWSRLLLCFLGLLRCLTWKNFHQICSSIFVRSGRMHCCVLLGPCWPCCRKWWRQGVMLNIQGSTLIFPLLLMLVPLGLMLSHWGLPAFLGPPIEHNTGKYRWLVV